MYIWNKSSSWVPVFFTFLITHFDDVSSYQTLVCSNFYLSWPLECTNQQWIKIGSETYAPEVDFDGTKCKQNITDCNSYFHDTGMVANCNGAAWRNGVACREEVDVNLARSVTPCLEYHNHIATLIQYECIESSMILDLCNTNISLTTASPVYMASPGYPESTAAGKMCTCTLKGSNLKINAIDISVTSRLPWDKDPAVSDIYRSVLSITSKGQSLWSSYKCADCDTIDVVNTNLFLPLDGVTYKDVIVTYADFGLQRQNVWLEVYELGPSLDVLCSSSSLPSDKIISPTTTLTLHTTTPTTTPATTTQKKTTSTAVVETQASTPTTTTTAYITFPTTKITATSSSYNATSTSTTAYYNTTKTIRSNDLKSSSTPWMTTSDISAGKVASPDNSDVMTIVLTVLLFLMFVIAALLGVAIYRRRHVFKSNEYISPGALLRMWVSRIFCQENLGDSSESNHTFDAVVQKNRLNSTTNTPKEEEETKDLASAAAGVSNSDNKRHNTESQDAPNLGDKSLIPSELYQAHQKIIDKEIVKIRQDIRSKPDTVKSSLSQSGKTNGSFCSTGPFIDIGTFSDESTYGKKDIARTIDSKCEIKDETKNVGTKKRHDNLNKLNYQKVKNVSIDNSGNKTRLFPDKDIDFSDRSDLTPVPSLLEHIKEIDDHYKAGTGAVDKHETSMDAKVEHNNNNRSRKRQQALEMAVMQKDLKKSRHNLDTEDRSQSHKTSTTEKHIRDLYETAEIEV